MSSAIVIEVGVRPEASCSCDIDTDVVGMEGGERIFPLKRPINQCCWSLVVSPGGLSALSTSVWNVGLCVCLRGCT